MAVADASFSTVKVSMSFGLIIAITLLTPVAVLLSMVSPSTTSSGSLLALSDEPPRMRICAPAPGEPPAVITSTPATLPTSMSEALLVMPLLISSGLMAVTEPVRSSFLARP